MFRFWALFKILLINNFGISIYQLKAGIDRRAYLKKLGMGLLIGLSVGPTLWLYTRLLIQGFDLLAQIGQGGAILTLGLVMVSSIVFFFGIFYVISLLYMAADAQNLLALPLSGWQVLGARFGVIVCYEYLTALPFLLPPLLVYGIKSGAPPIYWFFALVGILFAPLLPLSLATIPTVVVMRFANLSRKKDLFKILGGLVVIVLAIGYQFALQKSGPNIADPAYLQNLLTDPNGLMNLISQVFPSTRYLALALVNADKLAGISNLLIFAGLSGLAVGAAWLVGEMLYFQGLVGSSETTTRRKRLSQTDYQREGKRMPSLLAYALKEVRLLIRTPTYFMNAVMTNLFVPVLLLVPFMLQSRNQPGPKPWEALLIDPAGQTILMLAVIGIIIFMAGTNAIAATSISREGKEFYISKFMPLAYKKQIQAKLLSALGFGILGALIFVIAARILMPVDLTLLAMILVVGLVATVPVVEVGLLLDIARPKLVWENETQAFKQNMNVIFSMLAAIIIGGVILFIVFRFIHSPLPAAGFMLLCFSLAALVLYYVLTTWGIERYRQLEG